ncbi:hypothetical protein ABGB17_20325 [Sphaerisporangium sp. B11E5]|uniref:hypothetical protein n=1 Tax=Sphaerisporangium sp. B11E5 TaxID=3153563 RepID=UPI00325CB4E5
MPTDHTNQAAQIRDAFTRKLDKLRDHHNRGIIGTTMRDHEIAKAYRDARDQLATLDTQEQAARKQRRGTLLRELFTPGKDDGHDPATATLSYRDALDRVDRIEDAGAARTLLTRSLRTGDNLLAKALAQKASESGWGDVLTTYFENRPPQDTERYNEYATLARDDANPQARFNRAAQYVLFNPTELSKLQPHQVDQLADRDPTAEA